MSHTDSSRKINTRVGGSDSSESYTEEMSDATHRSRSPRHTNQPSNSSTHDTTAQCFELQKIDDDGYTLVGNKKRKLGRSQRTHEESPNKDKLCEQIDNLMSMVFMMGLLSTTYNMSLLGLKLIGNDPDKYKSLSLLVMLLIQLLICQWAPEVLFSLSKTLVDHAYFVPYSGFQNRQFRQIIHIMIMRCQIPIQLRAVGHINLSMESFGSMVTSAISFFTVLSRFSQ